MFNEGRDKSIQGITQAIEDEKAVEGMLSCRTDIVEIMRVSSVLNKFRLHMSGVVLIWQDPFCMHFGLYCVSDRSCDCH